MEHRILVSGFGGQGVLLIGQLLCYAGMAKGMEVSWLPSYGPEMRGGTASCSVILSDGEIGSPQVEEPDLCIVMNLPSFTKYEPLVNTGGTLFINSSLIHETSARGDIEKVYVPCSDAAAKVENLRTANIAMMGAFVTETGIFTKQEMLTALKQVFGERRAHLLPINEKVLQYGADMAKKA